MRRHYAIDAQAGTLPVVIKNSPTSQLSDTIEVNDILPDAAPVNSRTAC